MSVEDIDDDATNAPRSYMIRKQVANEYIVLCAVSWNRSYSTLRGISKSTETHHQIFTRSKWKQRANLKESKSIKIKVVLLESKTKW